MTKTRTRTKFQNKSKPTVIDASVNEYKATLFTYINNYWEDLVLTTIRNNRDP